MADVKVFIPFYSRTGVTEVLAKAVAEGAQSVGAEVRLRRCREFVDEEVMAQAEGWKAGADAMNTRYEAPTVEDAAWADAIIFGTPTRFGNVSSELKAYIDGLGGLWFGGGMNNKAGGVFTSTSSPHGGQETTIITAYVVLAHLGMVIVPTGYLDQTAFVAGSPYGATSVSANQALAPTENDLKIAFWQGVRTAQVAKSLKTSGMIS
jgi:NAD(P)H dehydrogenase (quinone)